MKKHLLIPVWCVFIIALSSSNNNAHPLTPQDCYTDYKNKGDSLSRIGNYDLAIKQYQAAKYCLQANAQQKKMLDDLIADMNRKKQIESQKKVVPRRF